MAGLAAAGGGVDERAIAEAAERDAAGVRPRIESFLEHAAGALTARGSLREAVEYALLGGGKRLRPMLSWLAAQAAGGDGARTLPAGAALELVHAFSLVHDDLPAMDDDDMRRGRPTLHVHAGEAMAILAGDAMLAMAFAALGLEPPGGGVYGPGLRVRLADELAAGSLAMIQGQVYDTLGFEGADATAFAGEGDRARVRAIHENKTGALLVAAVRLGGLVATDGAEDERLGALTVAGRALGLMFQIVDDLIDVEQTAEHTGKRTGKDAQAGKLTYPGVYGVDGARARVAELQDEAMAALSGLGAGADPLRRACLAMARRTK